jgi:prepilin-type processing-associated H-X9-DG protein
MEYTSDNTDRVPLNNGVAFYPNNYTKTWVNGWLTLAGGFNGLPGMDPTDNTNILYLQRSLLAPYISSNLGVWKCPSDSSLSTINGHRYPHVRTVSMNNWLGNYDPDTGTDNPYVGNYAGPGVIIRKTSGMIKLAPTQTYVLLDERDDSINDGWFLVPMGDSVISDYPSSYHSGAGNFVFADGHAERYKWQDARTNPIHQNDVHLWTSGTPSLNNQDLLWLQHHATTLKYE